MQITANVQYLWTHCEGLLRMQDRGQEIRTGRKQEIVVGGENCGK